MTLLDKMMTKRSYISYVMMMVIIISRTKFFSTTRRHWSTKTSWWRTLSRALLGDTFIDWREQTVNSNINKIKKRFKKQQYQADGSFAMWQCSKTNQHRRPQQRLNKQTDKLQTGKKCHFLFQSQQLRLNMQQQQPETVTTTKIKPTATNGKP